MHEDTEKKDTDRQTVACRGLWQVETRNDKPD